MSFHAYLFFSGTCREAFARYQEIFGGELVLLPMSEMPAADQAECNLPAGSEGLIMHAALKIGDELLMASDDPTGDGGPKTGIAVSYTAPDVGEAKRVFDALAEGGEVTMALSESFFSPAFGTCTDRFGVPWMVNTDAPQS
ncbi:VOC family protein [Sporichthya sp.]|uniref:VOC family protein n=1 Tax=Sporichthya sp. TaxID=65475 RepID=UPI00179F7588|nr:VOC family protein [Sporichthya sp.]MBA3743493.1 VOC family protein [Sporichthya sp.]